MSIIIPANSAVGGGFNVANSLRFNDGSSDYLTRSFNTTQTSTAAFTISVWVKRNTLGTVQSIFAAYDGAAATGDDLEFFADDTLVYGGGGNNNVTSAVFRDTSAWYNIVLARNSGASGAANQVKIYVNGVLQTLSANGGCATSQFLRNGLNSRIGTNQSAAQSYVDMYMSEFVAIDGQMLDATSFGEFDEDSGIWKPIDVSGLTFGNNGFYQEYKQSGTSQNSSGMGADTSGNDNHFAVTNLTAIDQSTDTCTNNAVTFMSNHPSADAFVLSQGGLQISKSGTGQVGLYGSSIMLSEGKWYWEVKFTAVSGSDRTRAGVAAYESVTGTSTIQADYSGFEFTSSTSGRFSITEAGSTTEVDGFNGFSEGDIIRFALDMDNTKLYVGRNGDWFNYSSSATGGNPASGSGYVTNSAVALAAPVTIYAGNSRPATGSAMELQFNFGATNTFSVSSGNQDANGYGNFEYAVPSGYFALNTKNLAEYG